VLPVGEFRDAVLDEPEEVERREIHHALEAASRAAAYQLDAEAEPSPQESPGGHRPAVYTSLMQRVCDIRPLDLGLARHLLRQARRYRIRAIVPLLLDNLAHFAPVMNDVVIYLSAIATPRFVIDNGHRLLGLLESPELADEEFVQYWLTHLVCRNPQLLRHAGLKAFVALHGDVEHQAHCALQLRDAASARRLRGVIEGVGRWQRRQVLRASLALARDERTHWYDNLEANNPVRMDAWLLAWLRSQ
jgi:hypothetical protein